MQDIVESVTASISAAMAFDEIKLVLSFEIHILVYWLLKQSEYSIK